MCFEVGADGMSGGHAWPGVTDTLEFRAYRQALVVDLGQGLLQAELTGEHPRAHHARREARAFLVGPYHHFQRGFGGQVQVVQGAQHLEAGHDPVAAVELATGGLGVYVAAGHHWRQGWVAPGAAGEDVADGVDADRAAGIFAPAHEQVAGLAVEVGQGQAAYATLGGGAEPGQVHQRLPEAIAVDQRALAEQVLRGIDAGVHGSSLLK
ncbi:hypothetical protein D3C76_466260 [compost metagenome]